MSAVEREREGEVAIRTPRLVLSPLQSHYATPLFELLNDWNVVRMLSEVPWPLRLEDTVDFIASMPSASTDDFAILSPVAADAVQSRTYPLILRCNDDAVGIASKDAPEAAACFEAPFRPHPEVRALGSGLRPAQGQAARASKGRNEAPQHEEGGVALRPIGVATIKKPGSSNPPRKMPRLGYWIGRKHWRMGYGTEAIGALVDYAFRTYPTERIGAGVFHDNPASRALLEKLGFRAMRNGSTHSHSRGGPVETVDMQITRSAWAARAGHR